MTSLSRLIAAATLISATALAPGLASADDHRCEPRDRDGRFGPAELHAAPPARHSPHAVAVPDWSGRDELRWDGRAWVHGSWDRRELGPRFAQARAVRQELRELERDRAVYHARFARQPRKLARYDARYLEQRAALERQLQRLTMYAWR